MPPVGKSDTANSLVHFGIVGLVIGAVLALGLGGEISGGEAVAVIAAAGGVGIGLPPLVNSSSRSWPPPGA